MTYEELTEEVAVRLGDGMALAELITSETVDIVEECAPGVAVEPAFVGSASMRLLYDQGLAVVDRLAAATTVQEALAEFAHGNVLAAEVYRQGSRVSIAADNKYDGSNATSDIDEASGPKFIDQC